MNKEYDFRWMVEDIDNCVILSLYDREKLLGNYQVKELLAFNLKNVKVHFANINDLAQFINYSFVRFSNMNDERNFLDIPLCKLNYLFSNSNVLGKNTKKKIDLEKLGGYSVYDSSITNRNLSVCSYLVNQPNNDIKRILSISNIFNKVRMSERITLLEELNLLNYHRDMEKQQPADGKSHK